MSFHPGRLVVCIWGGGANRPNVSYPKKGEVCTIRDAYPDGEHLILLLQEHTNAPTPCAFWSGSIRTVEPGFPSQAFRPLTDDRIAIFRKLLAPTPTKVDA